MKYAILALVICMVGVGCKAADMRVDSKHVTGGEVIAVNGGQIDGTGQRIAVMYLRLKDGTIVPMGNWSAASWGKQVLGLGGNVGAATMNGFAGSFNIESGLRDSNDSNNTTVNGGGAVSNASAGAAAGAIAKANASIKKTNINLGGKKCDY